MNKKLHLFLFLGLILLIFYMCKDKIESFSNPLYDSPFDFHIPNTDQKIMSGYKQERICKDDSRWKKGNKTCKDYSLVGSDCFETGDDGRTAFESCLIACDNCPSSIRMKRREPSPIEDAPEPSYSVFEESGEFGSVGGADYREIFNKLDELDQKIDLLTGTMSKTSCESISDQNSHDIFNISPGQNSYLQWYINYIFDKINFTGDISPTETNQLGTREQPIMGEFFDIFYEIINPPDEFEELQGYRTYQVKIRLKEPAGNVYALVSGGTISSEGAANVGSNRPGIIAPPAWQQPAPLGTNITPVPRGFIESQGIAAYDSWLTIVSDTQFGNGIFNSNDFDVVDLNTGLNEWSDTTGFSPTSAAGGSISLMDPNNSPQQGVEIIIAQITIEDNQGSRTFSGTLKGNLSQFLDPGSRSPTAPESELTWEEPFEIVLNLPPSPVVPIQTDDSNLILNHVPHKIRDISDAFELYDIGNGLEEDQLSGLDIFNLIAGNDGSLKINNLINTKSGGNDDIKNKLEKIMIYVNYILLKGLNTFKKAYPDYTGSVSIEVNENCHSGENILNTIMDEPGENLELVNNIKDNMNDECAVTIVPCQ